MSDIDDFAQGLAAMSPGGAEAPPVQAADTAPPQPQEQPQEPAQPAPAAEPAPQPEAPQEPPKAAEPGYVPIAAVLDERDKRKRLEAELAQYRAQQQPVQVPSVYDDPDGYQASVEARIATAEQRATAAISQRFALKEFGAEKVDEAATWYVNEVLPRDPTAQARFVNDPDPFGMVVRQHRQHQLMSQLGETPDLDAWFEKKAAELGYAKAGAAPAASLQPASPAPSRSLASAPSAGGPNVVPTGPTAALDAFLSTRQ